jgi:hypothetical protein
MKVIYIAGKYRAATPWDVEQNIRAAEEIAAKVWAMGHAALCPHANSRHMEGVASDEHFLAGTLELMRRCDAVLLVPNWHHSEGARAEVAEAERLGMPVFGRGESEGWARDLWAAFKDMEAWLAAMKDIEAHTRAEISRLCGLVADRGDPDGVIAARLKGIRTGAVLRRAVTSTGEDDAS